ncbi:hypothetical protein BB559_001762 [Furculomyces boomerangus]|uniref:Uncharacterized protein n=1 Tax=Furculomyces boomerangus TaxID=61424 RepID=A0A2T9Z0L1_9FUNG|nr:hypothetical protein BB559_001762 [Furculomyces boomerangus]
MNSKTKALRISSQFLKAAQSTLASLDLLSKQTQQLSPTLSDLKTSADLIIPQLKLLLPSSSSPPTRFSQETQTLLLKTSKWLSDALSFILSSTQNTSAFDSALLREILIKLYISMVELELISTPQNPFSDSLSFPQQKPTPSSIPPYFPTPISHTSEITNLLDTNTSGNKNNIDTNIQNKNIIDTNIENTNTIDTNTQITNTIDTNTQITNIPPNFLLLQNLFLKVYKESNDFLQVFLSDSTKHKIILQPYEKLQPTLVLLNNFKNTTAHFSSYNSNDLHLLFKSGKLQQNAEATIEAFVLLSKELLSQNILKTTNKSSLTLYTKLAQSIKSLGLLLPKLNSL